MIIILKCHYCAFYGLQFFRLIIIIVETGMLNVRGFVGIDKVALFSIGVCMIFSIVFVTLYRRDRRRLNDFVMKDPLCYELSTRFQLVENLRVLKIMRNASLAFSVWVSPPCVLLVLVYRYFLPYTEIGQIVFATFELILSLSVATLFSFSVVALCSTSKASRMLSCGNSLQRKVSDQHEEIHRVVTEKYFQLLQSAWT
ncbi:hypothetical protein V3C99_013613 [Haemonchus contortus]